MASLKKPPPGPALFDSLFLKSRDPIELVHEGVEALIINAERLFDDSLLLAESGRALSAKFLANVMVEEIGKIFILMDMIKLDFTKYENKLRRLCGGFYSHGVKHSYVTLNLEFKLADMKEAEAAFNTVKPNWIQGDYESGEPDMPNLWTTQREWSLYVDLFADSHQWFVPDSSGAFNGGDEFTIRYVYGKYLDKITEAAKKGHFEIAILRNYHEVFSQHYFSEASDVKELITTASEFISKSGLPLPNGLSTFWNYRAASPLLNWPLYHFV